MSWSISIVAAITVAVTARVVYMVFLNGRTISNASVFGRFISLTEQSRREFAAGWREQSWRYLIIAYPSILISVGVVSLMLYWMMPPMGKFDSYGDMIRYCLLVFSVGVSASLVLTFVVIFLVHFLVSIFSAWWNRGADTTNAVENSSK